MVLGRRSWGWLRWSNYLSTRVLVSDHATVTATAYVQPDLQDLDDTRLLADGRIRVRLSDPFGMVTSLVMLYDTDPPDQVEKLDVAIKVGLTFGF